MIDLLHIFAEYDEGSTHHRAAIIELQRVMPEELLSKDAEWVDIFEARCTEMTSPKIEK